MTALPAHSELGASQMERWDACPGSVALSRGLTGSPSIYAAEGTVAHEIAAFCLENGTDAREQVGNALPADGFQIEVTEEMTDAIQVYLDAVRMDKAASKDANLLVEHKFHLKQVHSKAHGTADAVLFSPVEKLLRVYDYKHGAGVPVDATGNKQLRYYGLGALLESGLPAAEIELVIVQPRCAHPDGRVRRWRLTPADMLEFSADLSEAIARTEQPDAPLVAGDHCRWCKAQALCPEINKQAKARVKLEFSAMPTYDPKQLAENLQWLPILEAWIKNVREFAYAEAVKGSPPPGFKLVDKRPVRKWANDEHTTAAELVKLGLENNDLYQPRELNSPAQIEKIVGAPKKNVEIFRGIEVLTVRKSSGTTLAPESDVREPTKGSAAQDFSPV